MTILSRLNGWQRLFVLFAVVVYLPLMLSFNTLSDNSFVTEKAIGDNLPPSLKEGYKRGDFAFNACKGFNWCGEETQTLATADNRPVITEVPLLRADGNYYSLLFMRKFDKQTQDAIADEIRKEIADISKQERRMDVIVYIAGFVIPLAVIYFIGAMVGWVVRGFKKPS